MNKLTTVRILTLMIIVSLCYGENRTKLRLDAQAKQENKTLLLADLFGEKHYSTSMNSINLYTVDDKGLQFEFVPAFLIYHLTKVVDLDATSEQISVSVYLALYWTDTRLQWDPTLYGGNDTGNDPLDILFDIPTRMIWFPRLTLANSVGSSDSLLNEYQTVLVYATGVVYWNRMVVLTSPCEMDVTFFPVDVQVCRQQFRMEIWPMLEGIAASERDFESNEVTFYDDSMWEMNRTEDVQIFQPTEEAQTIMTVQITLRRKYQYYMNRILAPVTILAVLVILSFFIPPDAGEKLGFGITLLLTFSVFQSIIDADLPASSNSTPLLTTAMVLLQVCSAMSIVTSVIVLNLHHLGADYGGNMPKVLKIIFFTILAKVTFHTGLVKRLKVNKTEPAENDTDIEKEAKEEETGTKEDGVEWKVAALIVDRLLMYVCLVTMVIVYSTLFSRLREAEKAGLNSNTTSVLTAAAREKSNALFDKTIKLS